MKKALAPIMRSTHSGDTPLPTPIHRREFLQRISLLGMSVPFAANLPTLFAPVALAADAAVPGKAGLTVLSNRPLNAETPPHLLDDSITPTARHFIRNNGIPPTPATTDETAWTFAVDGLVDEPLSLSIRDLKDQFEQVTLALTIECGGNGRAFFQPPARGNQWTYGAVACSEWTGVRLRDVLRAAKPQASVVYTAHYSADLHLSGLPNKLPISRGVPIAKAMTDNVLLAYRMNGAPLHPMNGAPLRLVVPGWPGSCSQKWLTKITLRDRVHDGPKMTGKSYRVPNRPVAPGEKVDEKDYVIIERMPVKSLITHPANMADVPQRLQVRGHAWSGDRSIRRLEVSIDFGATWRKAKLKSPANKGAWQDWRAEVSLPQPGYYEIWARATDSAGDKQPFAIDWNPKGYLNNTVHRVAIRSA